MPCNAEHMNPQGWEIKTSRLLCMLAELEGKTWEKRWWDGYHPEVYNARTWKGNQRKLNQMAQQLCAALKKEKDVTKYSLELQTWWRDHQAADKARIEKEQSAVAAFQEDLRAVLEKHSAYLGAGVGECSDTHGIYDEYMYVTLPSPDGRGEFVHTLAEGWGVGISDLREC